MVHVHRRRGRPAAACAALLALLASGIPAATGASVAAAGTTATATQAPVNAAVKPPGQRSGVVPGEVIVSLNAGTSVTGGLVHGTKDAARIPLTGNAELNTKLRAAEATSIRPLFPSQAVGGGAQTYLLQVGDLDSAAVAATLRGTSGVAYAEPDRYVNTMETGGQQLPSSLLKSAVSASASTRHGSGDQTSTAGAGVPANFALTDSAQSLLNAGGVDATGAFSVLGSRYGQLPGAGEVVSDVTVGDLTDQSMADAGDGYVQKYGPTTELIDGKRYLDLPSMPLIPAYVADPGGALSATESVENQDPELGEALLDFSVMSPLPDGRQRPGMTGSGYTDLLGIAPGADYRLVVPQQPTTDDIAQALLAAAQQTPRPNVITSTLGFGTDAQGLPGRYLEDDPLIRSVVAQIVNQYGIVVTISANDGTRLFTPAAVGPDGGSTPTDRAENAADATDIADDAMSTTPSLVPDTGAIAVGGTTLDDTLSAGVSGPATTAETRLSGFGVFSSGFGSRIDLSAPSDNVVAFSHTVGGTAQDVDVSLNGGTSASAPEVGAAAAVVLQASRLAGHRLSPVQVRTLLERTGRAVPTPAQIDQPLQVGPQIDVTAATSAALGLPGGNPSIVRLSMAHHVDFGNLGGDFLETTDPGYLDLGGATTALGGEGLLGPVTFAADVVGLPNGSAPRYSLTVGTTTWQSTNPAIRITPTQLLTAAHLPVTSAADRAVDLTYSVLIGGRVKASVKRTLTVGPTDGAYAEAQAPDAPAVAPLGKSVTVSYDLTGVSALNAPELVVSTVGHWNPVLAPNFSQAWSTPLTATRGTLTIPAGAFDDGGGIYGIGVMQSAQSNAVYDVYGEFTPIRIQGSSAAQRPPAPTLTGASGQAGHFAQATRADADFSVHYDVRDITGAVSAVAEFSAPGPTIHGAYNTYSNQNGTQLDHDGVDTSSTTHVTLPGTSGTARFNALRLGLPSSLVYGVRIFAVNGRGAILGQASPMSSLEFDDGPTPTGQPVLTFAAAGADSLSAIVSATGGTEVVHYDTATGKYGAVMASDPGIGSDYEVIGVAPGAHRALLAHQSAPDAPTMLLETWNTQTNTEVASYAVANAGQAFIVGQVDAARDRGAVLLQSAQNPDNAEVVTLDLASGTESASIPVTSNRPYGELAVDQATGDVYLSSATPIGNCLGGVAIDRIDPDTGAVTSPGTMPYCSHGIAVDGGSLYDLTASVPSLRLPPRTVLDTMDLSTGTIGDGYPLLTEAPTAMAIDPVHQLALISYAQPEPTTITAPSALPDNNATGELLEVDLNSGAVVKTVTGLQVAPRGDPLADLGTYYSLQLDPATRTGWTYGPDAAQVQQFGY